MARIRLRAQGKAVRLTLETRQFLDWKHYVKLFPWGAVAVAAAVGYFVVPRRLNVTRPEPRDLAELARHNRIVIAPQPQVQPQRAGLIAAAAGLIGNLLLRAGMAYATQHLGRLTSTFGPSPETPRASRHEHARPFA
jgi:hypothetical protein